jgi:hypothetical protein
MPTDKTKVIILTGKYKIEGQIDLIPGARLTDFVNNSNKFIAVTDAKILNYETDKVLNARFIDVLVNNIEIILPSDATG